ncbi:YTH domain [Dillenia turbinata]|uniref:YTH domain-containing family protein n=1 Tax=Dillenia turbinata TaxID=194707 RepID=A0AAN8VSC7_9MAGN
MAAVASPADRVLPVTASEAGDLIQKLSIVDSQKKTIETAEPAKKFGTLGSVDLPKGSVPQFTPSVQQDVMDPNASFHPNSYQSNTYVYGGGYHGPVGDWHNYHGVEMPAGAYGDESLMYHPGYGYAPYATYAPPGSPVPTMGHDGQLYGPQHYQYPQYFQQPSQTSGPYTGNQASVSQGDLSTSIAADQAPLSVDTVNTTGSGNGGSNASKPFRPSVQNSTLSSNGSYGKGGFSAGYQNPRIAFDGLQSPIAFTDVSLFSNVLGDHAATAGISSHVPHTNNFSSGKKQNLRPFQNRMASNHTRPNSGMGQASGFVNRSFPNNRMYGQYPGMFGTGSGFGSHLYDYKMNGHGYMGVGSKYKPRGPGNGYFGFSNENVDGLNELNRGPRAKGFKNQKVLGPVTLAVKGQSLPLSGNNNVENLAFVPDKERYNREDFPESYPDAKFFVIKSYSEDDIHKSIKYSAWTSTSNGNKKLDAAYQEAQEKSGPCPVNTSGQFVGIAEMVGPVDFNKSCEYWQQDKWTGSFPVKWHIVKDVPNSLLKHIKLENNEDKPVTNSRDTQETWEGKPADVAIPSDNEDKKGLAAVQGLNGSLDVDAALKEPVLVKTVAPAVKSNGEAKHLEDAGPATATEVAIDAGEPVTAMEKRHYAQALS